MAKLSGLAARPPAIAGDRLRYSLGEILGLQGGVEATREGMGLHVASFEACGAVEPAAGLTRVLRANRRVMRLDCVAGNSKRLARFLQ